MIKPKLRQAPMAIAAMAACMSAHAGYQTPDGKFSLSGFGTVGAVATNNNDVLFVYPGQGGGANKNISLNPDTKAAVQGTYKLTPTISGTAQVMSKYDADGQYTPNVEWAFAKWQAMPALTLRAGRMGAPFFMVSDFRDVGYANTAVRPNLDVYGQVPFSAFEGGDASYQANVGTTTITSSLWAGRLKNNYASALQANGAYSPPVEVTLKKTVGLNVVAEMDNGLTLRLGHAQGKLTSDSAAAKAVIAGAQARLLTSASPTVQAIGAAMIDAMTVNDTDASFSGVGMSYDQNDIVLSAEFTKRKIKSGYIADTKGWYLTGGYRLGSVLPYLSVSRLTTESANASLHPLTATVLGATNALVLGANAVLNTQKQSQNTIGAGVRWDAGPGYALKAQFDHVNIPANSNGLFLMADPVKAQLPAVAGGTNNAFLNKRKNINVLSVSLDFVF